MADRVDPDQREAAEREPERREAKSVDAVCSPMPQADDEDDAEDAGDDQPAVEDGRAGSSGIAEVRQRVRRPGEPVRRRRRDEDRHERDQGARWTGDHGPPSNPDASIPFHALPHGVRR
jgi:hypothetical protein